MENSIYLGLSRQSVLRTNMDIVANNVANMNTTGFRAQNILFEEYISDPARNDDPLSFVYDYGEYQNTSAGSHTQTGNPLNVAVSGPGFIAIQAPGGQTAYTRDGNFHMMPDGTLATSSGYPVLGAGGPIAIPAGSTEIVIDRNGVVMNQNGQLGQIQLVEFQNVQNLEAMGNNLYKTTAPVIQAAQSKLEQGFLEGSNVNPIIEMNRMIEILRDFQSTQRLLDTENERLLTAVQKLTKV